jgi:hypothetical protein
MTAPLLSEPVADDLREIDRFIFAPSLNQTSRALFPHSLERVQESFEHVQNSRYSEPAPASSEISPRVNSRSS